MNREEQILAAAQEYAGKKYRNDEDRAFAIKDFQAGAQWADDNPKSPWISVEERLPENVYSDLILAQGDNYVSIGFYNPEHKIWIDNETLLIMRPTHWMPIPKFSNVEPKK